MKCALISLIVLASACFGIAIYFAETERSTFKNKCESLDGITILTRNTLVCFRKDTVIQWRE